MALPTKSKKKTNTMSFPIVPFIKSTILNYNDNTNLRGTVAVVIQPERRVVDGTTYIRCFLTDTFHTIKCYIRESAYIDVMQTYPVLDFSEKKSVMPFKIVILDGVRCKDGNNNEIDFENDDRGYNENKLDVLSIENDNKINSENNLKGSNIENIDVINKAISENIVVNNNIITENDSEKHLIENNVKDFGIENFVLENNKIYGNHELSKISKKIDKEDHNDISTIKDNKDDPNLDDQNLKSIDTKNQPVPNATKFQSKNRECLYSKISYYKGKFVIFIVDFIFYSDTSISALEIDVNEDKEVKKLRLRIDFLGKRLYKPSDSIFKMIDDEKDSSRRELMEKYLEQFYDKKSFDFVLNKKEVNNVCLDKNLSVETKSYEVNSKNENNDDIKFKQKSNENAVNKNNFNFDQKNNENLSLDLIKTDNKKIENLNPDLNKTTNENVVNQCVDLKKTNNEKNKKLNLDLNKKINENIVNQYIDLKKTNNKKNKKLNSDLNKKINENFVNQCVDLKKTNNEKNKKLNSDLNKKINENIANQCVDLKKTNNEKNEQFNSDLNKKTNVNGENQYLGIKKTTDENKKHNNTTELKSNIENKCLDKNNNISNIIFSSPFLCENIELTQENINNKNRYFTEEQISNTYNFRAKKSKYLREDDIASPPKVRKIIFDSSSEDLSIFKPHREYEESRLEDYDLDDNSVSGNEIDNNCEETNVDNKIFTDYDNFEKVKDIDNVISYNFDNEKTKDFDNKTDNVDNNFSKLKDVDEVVSHNFNNNEIYTDTDNNTIKPEDISNTLLHKHIISHDFKNFEISTDIYNNKKSKDVGNEIDSNINKNAINTVDILKNTHNLDYPIKKSKSEKISSENKYKVNLSNNKQLKEHLYNNALPKDQITEKLYAINKENIDNRPSCKLQNIDNNQSAEINDLLNKQKLLNLENKSTTIGRVDSNTEDKFSIIKKNNEFSCSSSKTYKKILDSRIDAEKKISVVQENNDTEISEISNFNSKSKYTGPSNKKTLKTFGKELKLNADCDSNNKIDTKFDWREKIKVMGRNASCLLFYKNLRKSLDKNCFFNEEYENCEKNEPKIEDSINNVNKFENYIKIEESENDVNKFEKYIKNEIKKEESENNANKFENDIKNEGIEKHLNEFKNYRINSELMNNEYKNDKFLNSEFKKNNKISNISKASKESVVETIYFKSYSLKELYELNTEHNPQIPTKNSQTNTNLSNKIIRTEQDTSKKEILQSLFQKNINTASLESIEKIDFSTPKIVPPKRYKNACLKNMPIMMKAYCLFHKKMCMAENEFDELKEISLDENNDYCKYLNLKRCRNKKMGDCIDNLDYLYIKNGVGLKFNGCNEEKGNNIDGSVFSDYNVAKNYKVKESNDDNPYSYYNLAKNYKIKESNDINVYSDYNLAKNNRVNQIKEMDNSDFDSITKDHKSIDNFLKFKENSKDSDLNIETNDENIVNITKLANKSQENINYNRKTEENTDNIEKKVIFDLKNTSNKNLITKLNQNNNLEKKSDLDLQKTSKKTIKTELNRKSNIEETNSNHRYDDEEDFNYKTCKKDICRSTLKGKPLSDLSQVIPKENTESKTENLVVRNYCEENKNNVPPYLKPITENLVVKNYREENKNNKLHLNLETEKYLDKKNSEENTKNNNLLKNQHMYVIGNNEVQSEIDVLTKQKDEDIKLIKSIKKSKNFYDVNTDLHLPKKISKNDLNNMNKKSRKKVNSRKNGYNNSNEIGYIDKVNKKLVGIQSDLKNKSQIVYDDTKNNNKTRKGNDPLEKEITVKKNFLKQSIESVSKKENKNLLDKTSILEKNNEIYNCLSNNENRDLLNQFLKSEMDNHMDKNKLNKTSDNKINSRVGKNNFNELLNDEINNYVSKNITSCITMNNKINDYGCENEVINLTSLTIMNNKPNNYLSKNQKYNTAIPCKNSDTLTSEKTKKGTKSQNISNTKLEKKIKIVYMARTLKRKLRNIYRISSKLYKTAKNNYLNEKNKNSDNGTNKNKFDSKIKKDFDQNKVFCSGSKLKNEDGGIKIFQENTMQNKSERIKEKIKKECKNYDVENMKKDCGKKIVENTIIMIKGNELQNDYTTTSRNNEKVLENFVNIQDHVKKEKNIAEKIEKNDDNIEIMLEKNICNKILQEKNNKDKKIENNNAIILKKKQKLNKIMEINNEDKKIENNNVILIKKPTYEDSKIQNHSNNEITSKEKNNITKFLSKEENNDSLIQEKDKIKTEKSIEEIIKSYNTKNNWITNNKENEKKSENSLNSDIFQNNRFISIRKKVKMMEKNNITKDIKFDINFDDFKNFNNTKDDKKYQKKLKVKPIEIGVSFNKNKTSEKNTNLHVNKKIGVNDVYNKQKNVDEDFTGIESSFFTDTENANTHFDMIDSDKENDKEIEKNIIDVFNGLKKPKTFLIKENDVTKNNIEVEKKNICRKKLKILKYILLKKENNLSPF